MGYSASGNGPGGDLFSAIANGTYDTSIKGSVDAWAKAGYTTLVYRPGWEFNGNWYPWSVQNSTQLTNFIQAFQHMYTVLHNEAKADGVNLYVEWNPNTGGNQAGGTSTWMDWWPGSSYVDIVAIDSYGYPVNAGANVSDAGSSTDYSIIQSINFANTEGMLWSLTETGGDNSDNFITDLGSVLKNNPVQYNSFVGLWNTTQGGGVEWSAGSEASAYYTTFVTDNP
ncbi:hypothetical protein BN2475_160022 [Paraburkholderia ribeironis]|uniref:GH26 domain-containing protein n=2 Tax=Paraburkholderia ribeironis TaxID=1247936 RepID=A0A1N7RU55_9BURK|nr:hypothetical protein BN2475_160022 [Paraburkholderia ribeironis]